MLRFLPAAAFVILALARPAFAADDIYLFKNKGKKLDGNTVITHETAKGIELKSGDKYAAEDIDDIFYETPNSQLLGTVSYRGAFGAERKWQAASEAKDRATHYSEALDKYQKAAPQITDKRARTNIDFKLGYLRGKKALEDNTDPKTAIASLRLWVNANPNAWQVTRALVMLAKLQNDSKDYKGAAESYAELLKLNVSDDVKNDARLQGALAEIQLKRFAAAETKLGELVRTLPKGTKTYGRALVGLSECLFNSNKADDAIELLKKAIKESDDRGMRAVAYNTLGEHYYKADQLKEARWEFLWVDVQYNQDKAEHARALYYLSHIFDKLSDLDKAAQCRAALQDGAYAGTEYQRKLNAEKK